VVSTGDDSFRCVLSAIRGETHPATLKRPLYLPALVGDIAYEEEAGHNEFDTVRRGQFSTPQGGRGLNTAKKLASATLDVYTSWPELAFMPTIPQDLDPDEIRGQLYDLLRARRAFNLKVWRHGLSVAEINSAVTLRGMSPTVKQGEAGARYLTLEVKEWRDPTVDRRTSSASRKKGVKLPTTHILTGSDTLSSLSQEYYGSPNYWRTIAAANGISKWGAKTPLASPTVPLSSGVPAAPPLYKVGAVVRIPTKPNSLGISVVRETQQPTTSGSRARA
jgi:nucleoid-associated protein YgaU